MGAKKGIRPCKHVRMVRTRYGSSPRLINPDVRKKMVIDVRHRKLFDKMTELDWETGGFMDFNKDGLERVELWPGLKGRIRKKDDPDFEVSWHTHPPRRFSDAELMKFKRGSKIDDARAVKMIHRGFMFPSRSDFETNFIDPYKRKQAMIIFGKSFATVVSQTPESKKMFAKNTKKLKNKKYWVSNELDENIEKLDKAEDLIVPLSDTDFEKSLNLIKKGYAKKMKLHLAFFKSQKPIKISVKPVETDKS